MPEMKTCLDCIDAFDQCACELQTLRDLFFFVDTFARRNLAAVSAASDANAAAGVRTFQDCVDTCFNALELIDRLVGDVIDDLCAASERACSATKEGKPA